MTKIACAIAHFSTFVLVASSALGGGYEVAQQSAVAAGTGSAGTARSNDASAAWYNPAALADGKGLRAALGAAFVMSAIHGESRPEAQESPWSADTDNGISTPPHLYLSYARDNWATGVSVNTPFGSRVQWPVGWAQRFEVVSSEIQVFRVAPLVAYRWGPARVALGPQVDVARVHLKRATNHITQEGSSALVFRSIGFGGHASAFFDIGEHLQAGISYKSRTSLHMQGDADFNVPYPFSAKYPDQHVSTDWKLPDRLAFGGRFELNPWAALLDVTYTFWSVNTGYTVDFENEATTDREQVNRWSSSLALRGGVEYSPIDIVTLRLGGYFDGIPGPPSPADTLSPSSPDGRRVALTLGAGCDITRWLSLDAFYEHLNILERSSTGTEAPLATYRGSAHIAGVDLELALPELAAAAKPTGQ